VRVNPVTAVPHTGEMFDEVDRALRRLAMAGPGEAVVIVAGSPPGAPGSTTTPRVHRVGVPARVA